MTALFLHPSWLHFFLNRGLLGEGSGSEYSTAGALFRFGGIIAGVKMDGERRREEVGGRDGVDRGGLKPGYHSRIQLVRQQVAT